MLDYTSRKIVQLQKQYDMLVKSLNFTKDSVEKENINNELNRIEKDIIDTTEEIYIEEYNKLNDQKTSLLKEEKDRLVSLIELIENRRKYVTEQIENHKKNVLLDFDMPEIKGQDKIGEFQKRIKIIDKYRQNIRLKEKLQKEIETLKENIAKSDSKIKANDKINKELETKMIEMLEKSFNAMEIYSYKDREDEINLAFTELTFAKEKALQNVESARNANNTTLIVECEKMLDSVIEEYDKYFEKKMLLNLLYIYDRVVSNYDQLLAKRNEINDILSQIDSSDFYKLVSGEIGKQYNTIKLEQQDLKTYDSLKSEIDTKERLLNEIEEENNSTEFSFVLNDLIQNEKLKHEQELIEKRKKEYEERQQKLIEDSKKQEEIRKRQKLIEEARKRDIEIRTKELLEAKQKTVINPKVETFPTPTVPTSVPKPKVVDETTARDKFVDKILTEMDAKEMPVKPVNNIPNIPTPVIKQEEKPINDYDSILADFGVKKEEEKPKDSLVIPVIKNEKLVSKKVDEEKIDKNDVKEFMKRFMEDTKKDDMLEVNDIVFPDMPM